MGTLQNVTVAGLVADLGLTGHKGLAVALNPDDYTKLDVTVTPPAWVLLTNGTLFTTDLASMTVQAPTIDGSYHLYVDATAQVTATVPLWTIAATAPSVTALAIADVTVASHVISAATVRDEGLRSLPVQPSAIPSPAGVPVLRGPYVVDYTDIPHDGDSIDLFTLRAGDILVSFFDVPEGLVLRDTGNLIPYLGEDIYTDESSFHPHSMSSTQIMRVVYDNKVRPLRYSTSVSIYEGGPPLFEAAPLGWGQAIVLEGGSQNVRWDTGAPEVQYTAEIRAKSSTVVKQELFGTVLGDWVGTDDAGNAAVYHNNGFQSITTAASLCDGDWHSIAIVVTNISTVQLYVDGALVGTDLDPVTIATGFMVKNVGGVDDTSWTGSLDELALSTTAQYSTDYVPAVAPFSVDRPGLLALYHFDGDLLNAFLAPLPTQGHDTFYAMIARAVAP